MDTAPIIFSSLHAIVPCPKHPPTRVFIGNSSPYTTLNNPTILLNRNIRSTSTASVLNDIPAVVSDTAPAEITWEIVVGTLAGVAPFVVAGIEFSKRIAAQRKCKVCKGSGLVLRDNKYYFRCPRCGGFLPWQSWRRFFTG